ncbi:hypothetical protein [Pedobacter psychrotolerans]|uniref:hypothetical protein n=1 Tax=Pedobacter psychrotolerans TaxID=1843235 RepID=UPI003F95603E
MSIKMVKQKLKIGDIFYLEVLPNKYVFGRMLFDVDKQYHKIVDVTDPAIFSNQYLPYLTMSHDSCQLIEMYKGIFDTPELISTEILIPRVFTKNIDGKSNILSWGIVGNREVDYTSLEFPEQLNDVNGLTFLDRGELSIETKIGDQGKYNVNLKTSLNVPRFIGNACLFLQNRADLIPADVRRTDYIRDRDLLYYPELRNKIYAQLGLDPNMSYYELAKSKGFDLARFYDNLII